MRLYKQLGSLILAAGMGLLAFGTMDLAAEGLPGEAAQIGFTQMKDPVFNLDFCTAEEWAASTLGEGFPIHTIKAEALLEREETDKMRLFSQLVESTTDWYFPIEFKGRAVAMLFVSQIEGQWQVSGVGHAGIAQEMGEMLNAWKKEEGYVFRFVRCFEAKSDFLELYADQDVLVKESDPLGYLPFLSARVSLDLPAQGSDRHGLLLESQFIDKLAQQVEEGMKNSFGKPERRSEKKEK